MRLRLFHTSDGVRVAYRVHGTGRPLVMAHAAGLSHREFELLAPELGDRYRLVLCDLPAHGDSEHDPDRPFTFDWMAETLAAFCRDTGGPSPLVAGHGLGADLLLRAVELDLLHPGKLVLMPSRLHGPLGREAARRRRRAAASALIGRATAERRAIGAQPPRPRGSIRDLLPAIGCPTLLLWTEGDPDHPLALAEEALALLPDGLLRTVDRCGPLIARDDPVAVARELAAFLG